MALWSAGIILATGAAWLGFGVVWPFLHARKVVGQCAEKTIDLRIALGALGGRERARPRLQALLNSSDRLAPVEVRACSAYLFGYCGDRALPALRAAMRDRSEAVRICAVEAISMSGLSEPTFPNLLTALRDSSEFMRSRAVEGMGYCCWRMRELPSGSARWATENRPHEGELFPHFHRSCCSIGDSSGLEFTFDDWPQPDLFPYGEDEPCLPSAGPEGRKLVPILTGLLADESRHVRKAAAGAIEAIGADAREAVPALLRALDAEGKSERHGYLRALFAIRGASPEAARRVLRAATDADVNVRAMALRRAPRLPLPGAEVIPVLEKALEDEDKENRELAAAAIEEIRSKAGEK